MKKILLLMSVINAWILFRLMSTVLKIYTIYQDFNSKFPLPLLIVPTIVFLFLCLDLYFFFRYKETKKGRSLKLILVCNIFCIAILLVYFFISFYSSAFSVIQNLRLYLCSWYVCDGI